VSERGAPPRSVNGGRYHRFGSDAFAVVLDQDDAEVSDRHSGHLWVALSPSPPPTNVRADFLFVDDHGSSASSFGLNHSARSIRVALFVDGDEIASVFTVSGHYARGAVVSVDWSSMYEAMR
jgi:hypothetical protein